MRFQLQQCTSNPEEFNPELNNDLSIGVEIQDFASPKLLEDELEKRLEKYKKKLLDFKGLVSLHGAYIDLNPSSPDKKIVQVTKERYIQSLDIAKSLNSSYVVFHSQINPALKNPKVKEIKLNRQLGFWKELLEHIEETDIVILIENQFEDDFNDLLNLVKKINSPKIKVCLDVGHVLANSSFEVKSWINSLKPYIEYIHFHWNDGTYDAHKPPIEDFMKEILAIFGENNFKPILSLEYSSENIKDEVKRIRKYF